MVVKTGKIKLEVGKDLLSTISRLASKGTVHSIIELLANSYDADSTQIKIEYSPERDNLVISDNGEGMNLKGIESFFRTGDSVKKKNPISKKGRAQLGSFGVATILLNELTKKVQLTTYNNGKIITVNREFKEHLSLEDKLKYSMTNNANSKIGTVLNLTGLKFSEKDFSLKKLKNKIQWDLPVGLPDFNIFLNSEQIVANKLENSIKFDVDSKSDLIGSVFGTLHYFERTQRDTGIHIYVDGRRIGIPKELLLELTNKQGGANLIGIINANGLRKITGFDRTDFIKDSPQYLELKNVLKVYTDEINKFYRSKIEISEKINLESHIAKSLENSKSFLKNHIKEIGNETIIELGKSRNGDIGEYKAELNLITLNENNSILNFRKNSKPTEIDFAIKSAIAQIIAISRSKNSKDQLNSFQKEYGNLWYLLNYKEEKENEEEEHLSIFPNLLYKKKEVEEKFELSQAEINYLCSGGIFSEIDNRIKGQSLTWYNTNPIYNGKTSLVSLLEDKEVFTPKKGKDIHQIIKSSYKTIFPLVEKIGKGGGCYFIDDRCLDFFYNATTKIRGTKQLKGLLSFELNAPTHVDKLDSILNNVGLELVEKVIEYSNKHKLPFSKDSKKGVRVPKFIEALNHYKLESH